LSGTALRTKIENGEFIVAPGVFDAMSTLMANRVGFDCVYASGYWTTASRLGIPDVGVATYTEMIAGISRIVKISSAPVIADADTGYGGLLNVRRTVRGYERAGVAGIQMEDQVFPKKCGHTPDRNVVPSKDMLGKIAVALDARSNDDMLVIARTDSRTKLGLDDAIKRAKAFADVGADMVFVEALESEEEMRRVCGEVEAPLVANMADGGLTPIRPASELKDIGYACAIFPAISALAANAAVETALTHLKNSGTSVSDSVPLFDFQEFCSLVGFEDVWAFEKKWADYLDDSADEAK